MSDRHACYRCEVTVRDTFAAAALTGLISLNCPGPNQQHPQELCERAYRWADAMLRERGRQPAPPCVETDVFSSGSDNGAMRAVSERESPRRECGESSLRDVPQQDNCRAAGGPEPKSPMDVEELLGELHYIAGSGDHVEYDIRRTACDAEHAIDRLRAWVNELQLSRVEIDALQHVVEDGRLADLADYGRLRSLLVRLRPEWECGDDAAESATTHPRNGALSGCETVPDPDSRVWETQRTPQPHTTPPQGSVQGGGSVPDSRNWKEPVAWAVVYPNDEVAVIAFKQRDAEERASASDRITTLYRHPQPTLTDAEREAIDGMATYLDTRGNITLQAWGSLLRVLLIRCK